MYLSFFGLTEKPFAITPDPRYLYLSERHAEALAHLLYGINESGGFIQLTGEVGTGKTTVVRTLLSRVPHHADVAVILNPRVTPVEFLLTICEELGLEIRDADRDSVKSMVDALNRRLLEAHAEGRRIIVIVDEAQNLSTEVLEQVRLLTNLETPTQKLLQIILIGQPELRTLLDRTELRQLAQRITGRYHLEPLSRAETQGYVRHRLRVAGAGSEIFTPAALTEVHRVSQGIPRVINVSCDRALLGAYTEETRKVTAALVRRAAGEVYGRRFVPSWLSWIAGTLSMFAIVVVAFAGWQLLQRDGITKIVDWHAMTGLLHTSSRADPAPAAVTAGTAADAASGTTPGDTLAAGTVAADTSATGNLAAGTLTAATSGGTATTAASWPSAGTTTTNAGGTASGATRTTAGSPTTGATATTVGSPTAGATTSGATTAGSAAAGTWASPAAAQPVSINALLAANSANTGDAAAFRRLLSLWGTAMSNDNDPCGQAAKAGLSCLEQRGSWAQVRALNRPAILTLMDDHGQRHRVVLSALDDRVATLDLGEHNARVPLDEVSRDWFGEFTVVWKPKTPRMRPLSLGMQGDEVRWLRRSLNALHGGASDPEHADVYDEELAIAVQNFQREHRLNVDGIAGVQTQVVLDTALAEPGSPLLLPNPTRGG